jgi:membrane fusion protein (multidrug efflux system)
MKKLFSFVIAVALAAGIVWLIYSFTKKDVGFNLKNSADKEVAVSAVAVRKDIFENRIEALGTAEANDSITITAPVSECISEILFKEGSKVKKGDLLVVLNSSEEEAERDQAEVVLNEESLALKRAKTLRSKNAVSEQAYETQLAEYNVAKAKIDALKAKLEDRRITAPFSGVVGLRMVGFGAFVSPGDAITTLDDIDTIKLLFTVPEVFIRNLRTGQTIEAKCAAYPEKVFKGKVLVVDTRVNPETRAISVKGEFPNSDNLLKPGMLMTVELIGKKREAISVPEKTILSYGSKRFVYVVDKDSKAELREVETGLRKEGSVEILKGLKVGERIVTDGLIKLRKGVKLKVENPEGKK